MISPKILLLSFLFCTLASHAQEDAIDPAKRDSLIRSIDSSAKALKAAQDSFVRRQDSLYRAVQAAEMAQNTRNLVNLMAENKKREEKLKRQSYFRIGLGLLLLAVLVVGLRRRRRAAEKNSTS